MISAIYNFALTTGANRVIRGARIEHVCGDPALSPEKDYAFGMRIVNAGVCSNESGIESSRTLMAVSWRKQTTPGGAGCGMRNAVCGMLDAGCGMRDMDSAPGTTDPAPRF